MPDYPLVVVPQFDWSNTPGNVPNRPIGNGRLAIQQADGLLFTWTSTGEIRTSRLISPAEYAALLAGMGSGGGPISTDGLPEGATNLYFTVGRARGAMAGFLAAVATSGAYGDLTGRPALSAVATSGSAADLGFGILPAARLPFPTASALGGVKSGTAASGSFVTGIDTTGALTYGTPTGGGSGPANTDALPEGTTNLYFTQSRARNAISATGSVTYNASTGVISYTAPTLAAVATSGSASDLTTGTMPAGRLPAFTGDVTSSAGSAALTLAATGVTAGAYVLPTITLDAKGRATAASQGALTGDVTTTAGSLATTIANGVVAYAKLAAAALASAADVWANAASKLVSVAALWAAEAPVPLGSVSGTVTLDFNNLRRATATASASITFANPTNPKPGQTGSALITMGAANLTISYGSAWKPYGGTTPTAPTTSGALCLLSWEVYASGQIVYSLATVGA